MGETEEEIEEEIGMVIEEIAIQTKERRLKCHGIAKPPHCHLKRRIDRPEEVANATMVIIEVLITEVIELIIEEVEAVEVIEEKVNSHRLLSDLK